MIGVIIVKESIKIALNVAVGSVLLVLILGVIATRVEISSTHIAIVVFILVAFLALRIFSRWPWKRIILKPKSFADWEKESIKSCLSNNIKIPAMVDESNNLVYGPDSDINGVIGDYHVMRYKDPDDKISRTLFHDNSNNASALMIKGDLTLKGDAIEKISDIVQILKTGKVREKAIPPTLVKEIVQAQEARKATPPMPEPEVKT